VNTLNKIDVVDVPLWVWLLVIMALFSQAIYLFVDARNRHAHPWFWGIIGAITFPLPIILYAIYVRKIFQKKYKHGGT
jgi:hypothetical protein